MSSPVRRLPRRPSPPRRTFAPGRVADRIVNPPDASLLDVVDNVLNKGVVLTGDLTIALADVDLIYAKLSLLLFAADRVLPQAVSGPVKRRRVRPRPR